LAYGIIGSLFKLSIFPNGQLAQATDNKSVNPSPISRSDYDIAVEIISSRLAHVNSLMKRPKHRLIITIFCGLTPADWKPAPDIALLRSLATAFALI
jgi:hypothetical protein